jgi:hypothetical protein
MFSVGDGPWTSGANDVCSSKIAFSFLNFEMTRAESIIAEFNGIDHVRRQIA